MVDVGANVGQSLAPFLLSGWRVYAVEPDSANADALLASYGSRMGLMLDRRAVSDRDGENLALYRGVDSTMSTLSPFHVSHQPIRNVTTVSLSTLCAGWRLNQIDFLKIDAEGYDLFALRGMDWQIRPRVVMCEFDDKKTRPLGYSWRDMAEYMAERGYKILVSERFPLIDYDPVNPRRHRRFAEYPEQMPDDQGWGDFLCFQPEDFPLVSYAAPLLLDAQREVWNAAREVDGAERIMRSQRETIEAQANLIRASRQWMF